MCGSFLPPASAWRSGLRTDNVGQRRSRHTCNRHRYCRPAPDGCKVKSKLRAVFVSFEVASFSFNPISSAERCDSVRRHLGGGYRISPPKISMRTTRRQCWGGRSAAEDCKMLRPKTACLDVDLVPEPFRAARPK